MKAGDGGVSGLSFVPEQVGAEMSEFRALRTRIPGQSAISEFLAAQRAVPPRSFVLTLVGKSPLTPQTRSRYRGVLGELVVGEALDGLGARWDVLHAVPVGAGEPDIDHVVVGPAGVFTVTTRTHAGHDVTVSGSRVTVGGAEVPHIRSAQFDAERAATLLSRAAGARVAVTAMLVIVDPHSLSIRARPADVTVVSSAELLGWFERAARVLDGEAVARISDIVDRESTWHADTDRAVDGEALFADFSLVRAAVNAAVRRRIAWALFGVLVTYGVLWGSITMLTSTGLGS